MCDAYIDAARAEDDEHNLPVDLVLADSIFDDAERDESAIAKVILGNGCISILRNHADRFGSVLTKGV